MSKQIEYIKLLGIQDGFNMYRYSDTSYSLEQIVEIYRGFKEGLDVSVYDDVNNSPDKMYMLRECLFFGISKTHLNQDFSVEHLEQILDAHRHGVDVSYLLDDIPINDLIKKKDRLIDYINMSKLLVVDDNNMAVINDCFIKGYDFKQIKIIARCLNNGLDATYLLKSKYSEKQSEQLYLMIKEGINPKPVAKPDISWVDMALYRLRN